MAFARNWKVPIGILITILALGFGWGAKSMIGLSPSEDIRNALYKAPLHPEVVDPKFLEPDLSYLIYLARGHTLQKHSEAIDRDITPYIREILKLPYYVERDQVVFSCERVDDKMLDDIRSDPGVERVEYNGQWKLGFWEQGGDGV